MKIYLLHIESESPSLFGGGNNETIPCKSLEVARKTLRYLVSKFLSEAPKTYGMDDVNVRKYIDTDSESMFYFYAIGYGSEYYYIEEKDVLEHPYGYTVVLRVWTKGDEHAKRMECETIEKAREGLKGARDRLLQYTDRLFGIKKEDAGDMTVIDEENEFYFACEDGGANFYILNKS